MTSTGSEEKDTSSAFEVTHHRFDLEISESLGLCPQELRRLKRIVDWRIVPYISLLYFLSALVVLFNLKFFIFMLWLDRLTQVS